MYLCWNNQVGGTGMHKSKVTRKKGRPLCLVMAAGSLVTRSTPSHHVQAYRSERVHLPQRQSVLSLRPGADKSARLTEVYTLAVVDIRTATQRAGVVVYLYIAWRNFQEGKQRKWMFESHGSAFSSFWYRGLFDVATLQTAMTNHIPLSSLESKPEC